MLRLVILVVSVIAVGSPCALAAEVKARSQHLLSMDQIKAEYGNFKKEYPNDSIGFESFASQMDKAQDDDRRFEAYKSRPDLYPIMSLAWIEGAYRDYKKSTKDQELSILDFAWQMDAYEGGRRYFVGYKKVHAERVILYGFMGVEIYPVLDVLVLDKKSGYICLRQRSGKLLEYSGRYSIGE